MVIFFWKSGTMGFAGGVEGRHLGSQEFIFRDNISFRIQHFTNSTCIRHGLRFNFDNDCTQRKNSIQIYFYGFMFKVSMLSMFITLISCVFFFKDLFNNDILIFFCILTPSPLFTNFLNLEH